MVFDNDQRDYQSGTPLGLPLTDFGWGSRKIFVVNKGETPAGFTAQFIGAVRQTSLSIAVFLFTLVLLIL
jgi:hypothetical protein